MPDPNQPKVNEARTIPIASLPEYRTADGGIFDPASSADLMNLVRRRAGSAEETGELLAGLDRVARVILGTSEFMNLTGDRDPRLFWERQMEDSLWAAEEIERAAGKPGAGSRILDVGSGGGIPGLIWMVLWPQAKVNLLESRRRKTQFLREAIRHLGRVGAEAFENRAEVWGHEPREREQYDLVTARALAALPTLLELTLPFVRVGGYVAAIKTAQIDEELAAAREALRRLGSGPEAVTLRPYTRSDGKPCQVCLVRKLSPTPRDFPRPANLPERWPLGLAG